MAASKKKQNLQGRYANYFKVGHNAFEFVFDLGQYYGDDENLYKSSEIRLFIHQWGNWRKGSGNKAVTVVCDSF